MNTLLEGLVAGLGVAVPVGAITLLIIDTGIRSGFRQAFAAGAGAAGADFLYALVAAVGGAVVAAWLAGAAKVFAVAGGVVLVVLGAWGLCGTGRDRTPRDPGVGWRAQRDSAWPTFVRFLALTLVNAMTVVYFAALITGTAASRHWTALDFVLFLAGAGSASLCWQTLLAAFGHVARHVLSLRTQAMLSVLGNLLVCGLGVRLALHALL